MALPFIHIPKPCSENWDKMTPTACGRFCNVCQKEVIDLSVMDDATVTQTLTEKGGALCVRARADQVTSNTSPVMVRSIRLTKLALFALALVCVFSCDFTKSDSTMGKVIREEERLYSKLIVRVMYTNGKAVPYAQVEMAKYGQLTQIATTDEEGFYVFKNLPVGYYSIVVSKKNHIEVNSKIKIDNEFAREVLIELSRRANDVIGDATYGFDSLRVRDSLPLNG